jgi:hypothetical protein
MTRRRPGFASMEERGGTQGEPQAKARRGAEIIEAPAMGEGGGHVEAPATK